MSEISKRMRTIYFAQLLLGGPIKIGCTINPSLRLADLQKEFSAPLQFIATAPGRMCDEALIHRTFSADRFVDEWFHPSDAIAGLVSHVRLHGSLPKSCIYVEPTVRPYNGKPREWSLEARENLSKVKRQRFSSVRPVRQAARADLRRLLMAGAS